MTGQRGLRRAGGALCTVGLAIIGVGVASYLTAVHYAGIPLVCSSSGVVDCAAVTGSAYSVVPGTSLPITIPGILWFVVSGALAGLAALRVHDEPGWLRPLHAGWALLGLLAALYLVYVEVVRLHRLCEWCTAVHVLILLTFVIALARLLDVVDRRTAP
ncbi:MAG: vitamin K epoxide reductase family protein [Candidatus Dormibacteria bacterium]